MSKPTKKAAALHQDIRERYVALTEAKKLAGLPLSLAEDTARRQLVKDHGVEDVTAALSAPAADESAADETSVE